MNLFADNISPTHLLAALWQPEEKAHPPDSKTQRERNRERGTQIKRQRERWRQRGRERRRERHIGKDLQ